MLRDTMTASESISCALVLYVQPVLCLIGFMFNLAFIVIFLLICGQEYYRKTSLILYLVSLSICNLIQLVLTFFVIILPAFEQFMDDERYPNEYAMVMELNSRCVRFAYPLLMASNYVSIWLLVLICAQRFQSICHPANAWKMRLQFTRRSRLCIACCILLAAVINLIRFWELQPIGEPIAAAVSAEGVAETSLRNSTLYKIIQEGFLYGFVVYCIPMSLIIWLNYHTFKIVLLEEQSRSRPSAEHRVALMTVCVFIFFFLFTTMSVTLRLILILSGNLFARTEFMWIVDLSNLLMNANALVMPLVCFIYTRGFRDLFFVVRYVPASIADAEADDFNVAKLKDEMGFR